MKKYYWVALALAVTGSLAFWGCKNGNMFGGFHSRGSGDPVALLSDAKSALVNREFENAKAYYEAVLAKDPRNSEALYGAATATMGTAGLDMGTLLGNIITAKGASGSASLGHAIQHGAFAPSAGVVDQLSLLANIDLDKLGASIDQIVCFLLKIRSGLGDGTITKDDISLLMSIGIICFIRAVLRPLAVGVIDFRQTADGKSFDVVVIDSARVNELCANRTIHNSASDIIGAIQAIQDVVRQIKSQSGSTINELELDARAGFNKFKEKINVLAISQECKDFVNRIDLDRLSPPTQDPGDCLNKTNDTKDAHFESI